MSDRPQWLEPRRLLIDLALTLWVLIVVTAYVAGPFGEVLARALRVLGG